MPDGPEGVFAEGQGYLFSALLGRVYRPLLAATSR
jgi:hypothetical protein